jgi:orotate phosphoribosyltransferase
VSEDRERLLTLLKERSFERRRVVLSSGKESDFYVDCKPTALCAEGHYRIGRLFLEGVPEEAVAAGGLTLGADPLASAVSHASFLAGRPIDAFIVRKEPKGHGTGRWIEGPPLPEGAKVVILEDVVTTGASTLRAIERVREAGLRPLKVLALVDRLEGGREAVEASGVPLEALFTRTDFIPDDA